MTTRSTRSPRRRTVVALGVVLAVLVAFIMRLVDIQVVNADAHVKTSLEMAFGGATKLYGMRGAIVDESGQTLAGSILQYDAQLDPSNVGEVERKQAGDAKAKKISWATVAGEIGAITGQSADDVQKLVADALALNPKSQYVSLKKGLSTEQYRALADLDVPFMYFTSHPARTYPDGAVAGNLVGFVGSDGDALAGLEQTENDCLTPSDGLRSFERGKDGVIIPGTEVVKPAVDGGTLKLTIDRDLQWYLQQLIAEQVQNMGAKSGTITVMEVGTGKLRAAAEYPTVDPNNVDGSLPEDRGSRIFTNWFEPGSTFKGLTASTLIDAGGQTPTSTVDVSSVEHFPNGAVVHDSFEHPTYQYTLTGVLIDSSNAGAAKLSERVPAQTRYDYLKKFGIGEGSGVHFPGELKGDLPPVSKWDNQTLYNTAFGQGVTTTVPELVAAYGAIADGGVRVPATLVESCTKSDGTVITPDAPAQTRVISQSTSDQMREVLENVALQANYANMIQIPGYRIAVKTGTGEKHDDVTGGYKSGVYFTTMIGFAPAEAPKYVVAVTLDEPTRVRSSSANAPAFQEAMTQVLKTYRVMPSTTAPTLLPKFG